MIQSRSLVIPTREQTLLIHTDAELTVFVSVARFEGSAALMQARGRPLLVQVIVMSDVVFFLQESNQKYHFVSQEGKVSAAGHAPPASL